MLLLKKITLILLFCLLVSGVSYMILKKGLNEYKIHTNQRLTEILKNKTKYDILFIGSSRTHTGINPKIVDSILNCSSYNAGVEGGNLLEFKMTFDAYLINHPPPKYLVLTLDLYSFNLKRPFFNYTNYLDFLDNKIIDSTLCANGHNTTLFKIVPFAKITEYDDFSKGNAIKALMHKGNEIGLGEFQYKGYLSNTSLGININTVTVPKNIKYPVSDTAIEYLKDIIKTCIERKIKLLFTYAPEYKFELQKNTLNKQEIFEEINAISKANSIPFYRDDSLSICDNPMLFANPGHLNTPGATTYSLILGNRLKEIFTKF